MKKINFIKIILDILMSIVFVLLFNKMAIAGLMFHEIAGLSIGLAFLIHITLNWKWVKNISLKFFDTKLTFKTRLGYIIDVLLLFSMLLIIISGILISKVLFRTAGSHNKFIFQTLHISISYIAILLIGVHIGLHWTWVINILKKIFKITEKNKMSHVASIIAVFLIFFYGAYNIYSTNYCSKASSVIRIFNENSLPPKGKDLNKVPPSGESNSNFNGDLKRQFRDGQGIPSNIKKPVSSSTFNIFITNLSIIAFFSIVTYYLEKLIKRHFKLYYAELPKSHTL